MKREKIKGRMAILTVIVFCASMLFASVGAQAFWPFGSSDTSNSATSSMTSDQSAGSISYGNEGTGIGDSSNGNDETKYGTVIGSVSGLMFPRRDTGNAEIYVDGGKVEFTISSDGSFRIPNLEIGKSYDFEVRISGYKQSSIPKAQRVKVGEGVTKLQVMKYDPDAKVRVWFKNPVEKMKPNFTITCDGETANLSNAVIAVNGRTATASIPSNSGSEMMGIRVSSNEPYMHIDNNEMFVKPESGQTCDTDKNDPLDNYLTNIRKATFIINYSNCPFLRKREVFDPEIWLEGANGHKSLVYHGQDQGNKTLRLSINYCDITPGHTDKLCVGPRGTVDLSGVKFPDSFDKEITLDNLFPDWK